MRSNSEVSVEASAVSRLLGFGIWDLEFTPIRHPTQTLGKNYPPFIAGNICRTIVMAAGPTRITKMPGKMKITSGKISFTAVFAAFSSAN
jgi:hypothetical protein